MVCKTLGRRLHATAIELRGERLSVRLGHDTALPAEHAAKLATATKGRLKLAGPDRIVAKLEGGSDETRLRRAAEVMAELCAALPATR
jgi:hypothetical protein